MSPSITPTTPVWRSRYRLAAAAAGSLLVLLANGCASGSGTAAPATTAEQSADSPITVWVDASRAPAR